MGLITDSFSRVVDPGWGVADTGEAWTGSGGAANKFVVNGVAGRMVTAAAAKLRMLLSTQATDVDLLFKVAVPSTPSGDDLTVKALLRATALGRYIGRVRFGSDGKLYAGIAKATGSALITLAEDVEIEQQTHPLGTSSIVLRAVSSGVNAAATTLVLDKPAGVVSGDVMVAQVATRNAPTYTAPSGWTLLHADADGTVMKQATYIKVAGGAEPSNYTWTFGSATTAAGGIWAASGQTGTPNGGNGGYVEAAADTPLIKAPTISTAAANEVIICFYAFSDLTTFTVPGLMTKRYELQNDQASDLTVMCCDQIAQAGAGGATGDRRAISSVYAHAAGPHGIGAVVALKGT